MREFKVGDKVRVMNESELKELGAVETSTGAWRIGSNEDPLYKHELGFVGTIDSTGRWIDISNADGRGSEIAPWALVLVEPELEYEWVSRCGLKAEVLMHTDRCLIYKLSNGHELGGSWDIFKTLYTKVPKKTPQYIEELKSAAMFGVGIQEER